MYKCIVLVFDNGLLCCRTSYEATGESRIGHLRGQVNEVYGMLHTVFLTMYIILHAVLPKTRGKWEIMC